MSHTNRVGRRELLRRSLAIGATIAGTGVLAGCDQRPASTATSPSAPLPAPETTTVRWVSPPPCDPLWLAKDYLLEEGFKDVLIVPVPPTTTEWLTADKADFNCGGYGSLIAANVDAGLPMVTLAGMHPGCLELFATPGISTIRDLRGKTIAVNAKNVSDMFYTFFSILLAYVGVDPRTEVNFIEVPPDSAALRDAFLDGRSQAFIAPAASGPLLRRNAKNPGKVILDTTMNKPWSQYYCCNLVANRDWARRHPVATKRFTRAILRATDAVAKDKPRAAREYVAAGYNSTTASPVDEDLTNEIIRELSYDWRELDPEETLRFFALRLADAKLIKSTPQQIIAQASDFAFMRQMRTELKL